MRRVVLLSSIGVYRAREFPFAILNLFGVLDAKRRAEEHVAALREGRAIFVVRPGRLVGGPHTNVGMYRGEVRGGRDGGRDVVLRRGEVGTGEVVREDVARVLHACVRWKGREVVAMFSVLNGEGGEVDVAHLGERLDAVIREQ